MRRHWLFAIVLALGVALRVLVQIAYWPAMFNADSHLYLRTAFDLWIDHVRPAGFGIFMHITPGWQSLWPVTLAQHLLGIACAVGIYIALLRWRVPEWIAALATVPVLLDPLQLALEQFILADALNALLVVGAVLLLAWRRRIGVVQALLAGALLAAAATVRAVATPLIVLAVVVVVVAGARRLRATAALLAGFAVVMGSYMAAYHDQYGKWETTDYTQRFLYARIGLYVHCPGLRLPDYEKALCPYGVPTADRTTNLFLWQRDAYIRRYKPPAGMTVDEVLADFNRRALEGEPVAYAKAVVRDTLRGFAPHRGLRTDNGFDAQWELGELHEINLETYETRRLVDEYGLAPRLNRPVARLLGHWQHLYYTRGPLLAACFIPVLLAAFGAMGSRRFKAQRLMAVLAAATALALVVIPAATASFAWRYQVGQLPLLPFAGALALGALLRGRAEQRQAASDRSESE